MIGIFVVFSYGISFAGTGQGRGGGREAGITSFDKVSGFLACGL